MEIHWRESAGRKVQVRESYARPDGFNYLETEGKAAVKNDCSLHCGLSFCS
jgi:hypothetical protein